LSFLFFVFCAATCHQSRHRSHRGAQIRKPKAAIGNKSRRAPGAASPRRSSRLAPRLRDSFFGKLLDPRGVFGWASRTA
jgi:hypothetical protein